MRWKLPRELANLASAYLSAPAEQRASIGHNLLDVDAAHQRAVLGARWLAERTQRNSELAALLEADVLAARSLIALDPAGRTCLGQCGSPSVERLAALESEDQKAAATIADLVAWCPPVRVPEPEPETDWTALTLPKHQPAVTAPSRGVAEVCASADRALEAILGAVSSALVEARDALPNSLPGSFKELRRKADDLLKDSGWLLRRGLERMVGLVEWVAGRIGSRARGAAEPRPATVDRTGQAPAGDARYSTGPQ